MHSHIMEFLKSLQDTVKSYENISKTNTGIQKPDWMRWDKDRKDLGMLSEATFGVAAGMMNDMIMPNQRRARLEQAEGREKDVEGMARELLKEAMPEGCEESWGNLARVIVNAFSGVDHLIRGLSTP
jgi:hypothetical protein